MALGASTALLVGGLVTLAPSAQAATAITVDGHSAGRTFDGVGSISGGGGNSRLLVDYPEPQRSQVLNYLFKPHYGASLQMLKVEIGGDTNSTSGSELSHEHFKGDLNCNRGYEWWLMEQAKKRNPHIKLIGLAWGAPGWIGNDFDNQNMIGYMVDWLGCAKKHDLSIDYLTAAQNERWWDAKWTVQLRQALDAHGFKKVKLTTGDMSRGWEPADTVVTDKSFADAVDVIGAHYPCTYRSAQTTCETSDNALKSGKPLWASENGSDDYNDGAQALARGINRSYIDGKMTGYLNWPLVGAVTPNIPYPTMGLAVADQPWSGAYSVGKNAWVIAHTTQFTQPGWQYLDGASGYIGGDRANGSYVTLKSPNGRDYSSVVETMDAKTDQTLAFKVGGGLSAGTVHVWSTDLNSTDSKDYFVHMEDIVPVKGTFSVPAEPGHIYTITTTRGQAKGTATGKPAASLALPYQDDFDSYGVGRQAKYLQDQQGAFEIAKCGAGRSGKCVRQSSPQDPIHWTPWAHNYTLLGDIDWKNYTVSTDVMLEKAGNAELIGRANWEAGWGPEGLDAYYLRVADDGQWSILRNNTSAEWTTLAQGQLTAGFGTGTWHKLALTFNRKTITAAIDGTDVGSVTDSTWGHGQIGYGTSVGETAQFDNLTITPGADVGDGTTAPLLGKASGRCVNVPGDGTAGTNVELRDCDSTATTQQWTWTAAKEIRNGNGLCLAPAGTAAGSGAVVQACDGSASQKWDLTSDDTVAGVDSGLCLDAPGWAADNGTKLDLWTCNGGGNQTFAHGS